MQTVDERNRSCNVKTMFCRQKCGSVAVTFPHYRTAIPRRRSAAAGWWECAVRPFHVARTAEGQSAHNWPTCALRDGGDSEEPAIRFRHVGGITKGMDVEWTFHPTPGGTHVRIVHLWDGPRIPLAGTWAARFIIGPIFVHGIASRTLAGLGAIAEREARAQL